MASRILAATLFAVLFIPTQIQAQTFSASGHFASAQWSEFDGSDKGLGGRVSWMRAPIFGVEGEVTWYPSEFQPDGVPFSRRRLEGSIGATIGPRINRVRPFAKVAAGFLNVSPTNGAFACIAIFPPPLSCQLAGGDTLPAFEIGGGISADITARTFVRVDIADRVLRYPGPTIDSNFDVRDDGYFGHALRFTLGAGFKF